jgi:hypothetical protein
MKKKLRNILASLLLLVPVLNYAQAPPLGTAANFVLFSTNGAVSNSGISQLTGNVGTNNGSSTAFGNVNGGMHDGDGTSAQCASDLLIAYNQLNSTVPTFFPAPLLGNGDTLVAGVYSISSATTINLALTLNANGDANAVFIFQIQGPLSTNANSKIKLINGAMACNVFWKVEGLVSMASGTSMKGTIIANNAAINMNTGDTLEGRALSTAGAVIVDGILAYTPIGCGSPVLSGPIAPSLGSAACYGIFSSNGAVSNSGITHVTGDVGTNVGLTTGFDTLLVTGKVHPIPDGSTAACAADLLVAYNYINTLPYDIELLYPAQFGNNLVLTPHTYLLNGAVTFTDTLYLNAMGMTDAVFVIQINGAISTSTYSKVILINGAQAKNVYWKVEGAVSINNYSIFNGTIICNNGALGALNTGVVLNGRALTTNGALTVTAATVTIPSGCSNATVPVITSQPVKQTSVNGGSASFSIVATGTGLTYQWRKGIVNLADGGAISGATSSTLTINPVSVSDTASNYNVVISGTNLTPVTSANVALAMNAPIAITTQPVKQTLVAGGSASFSIVATGTGLTYQWRKGIVNLTNTGNISGATTATLTINPVSATDTATNYNVVISGTNLTSVTSANVALFLYVVTSITTQPVNLTICEGSKASFSVVAAGTGLTYQWRRNGVNIINGGTISGATSDTLRIMTAMTYDAATNYNVVVSSEYSATDTSSYASLVINTAPTITTEPIKQMANVGSSISFTVIATGTNITYQWKKGFVNIVNGGNISGATSATLTINPVAMSDTAFNYNVVISGTCPLIKTSVNVSLSVNDASGINSKDGNSTEMVSIYPNPFKTSITIVINDNSQFKNYQLKIYNELGAEIVNTTVTQKLTIFESSKFLSGIYFYKVFKNDKIIQTGKMISQQ